jgi:transcriptional regulator GlxA family with amidase domain
MNSAMTRAYSGRQLALQMRLMCEAARAGKFTLADQMSVPVLGLLQALVDEMSGERVSSSRPDLDGIKNVARNHLSDPDLDIHRLARVFHCTARTIQARFAESDETFSRWMLAERLDLARAQLTASIFGPRSIEAIAFSCGFRDTSHFHRAFKARFSLPPGDMRH